MKLCGLAGALSLGIAFWGVWTESPSTTTTGFLLLGSFGLVALIIVIKATREEMLSEIRDLRRQSHRIDVLARETASDIGALAAEVNRVADNPEIRAEIDKLTQVVDRMPGSIQNRLRHDIIRDVNALLTLDHAYGTGCEGVPLTNYSALPATAVLITEYIRALPPSSLVVELGSGTTTLWTALAMRARGNDLRFVSLEASEEWAAITRAALERNGVGGIVDLRVGDLSPMATREGDQMWYPNSLWEDLSDIDLVIVDGPPGDTGKLARYPVVETLGPRLRNGAVIVMDDTNRRDEKRIVELWIETPLPRGQVGVLEERERTTALRLT